MAKARRRAGKRALAVDRDRPRARKSGSPKASKSGSRKPEPAKSAAPKQEPSAASESASLKRQLKAARLQTREALERQTATAEILKVIASSPSDVQPVFEAIALAAVRLLGCDRAFIQRCDGANFWTVAWCGPEGQLPILNASPIPIDPEANFPSRAISEKRTLHLPDWSAIDLPEFERGIQERLGINSALYMPLLREGECIGLLAMAGRRTNAFGANEIALAESFRDQALIAIENVRLFNETREALERETSTAEILQVISSSPTDVQPVFDAIVASLLRLFGTQFAAVQLLRNGIVTMPAVGGKAGFERLAERFPRPLDNTTIGGLVMQCKQTRQFVAQEDSSTPGGTQRFARDFGFNSVMFTPMIHEGEVIGSIGTAHPDAKVFDPQQISLIETFARQAVIAIQNVRLFNETQEALERQAATSDILRVISQSPTDVQPVFDAIVLTAVRLIGCDQAFFLRCNGSTYLQMARATPEGLQTIARPPQRIDPDANFPARAIVEKKTLHLPDWSLVDLPAHERLIHETFGIASSLYLPLIRAGECIGLLVLAGKRTNIFGEREIALAESFRDQAVIAIENVRLFDEVQAKTSDLEETLQQQIATADVLKVISRSAFDLQTVLDALLTSASRLCQADHSFIFLREGDAYRFAAGSGGIPEWIEYLKQQSIQPGRGTVAARAVLEAHTVHIPDVLADQEYTFLEAQKRGGFHTALGVPLLREGTSIGVMVLTRPIVRPFDDSHIALVTTFADQAVIAIENIRLFESVEARTRELSQSLEDLRKAKDRLVQTEKLASLGQLTAGIAHEIKNPLNFVNNFSALSAELTDELNDVLKPVAMNGKVRGEVDELTGLLKDNLQKVVQHGKRADSIVKNMLLHSRESSGEHRPADINSLLDESLNLAYHGARAEKGEFNITLQRDFDADAGTIELFPQEITRAFLNLISNGVYAATRRKTEDQEPGFEPILRATTKNLGSTVEIRIRDNGTGIPAEVREKMFNPFFTTKPAGEGTGLGLSMTHDIIVKQHGGRIDVETEPGRFTEFKIVLPRASQM